MLKAIGFAGGQYGDAVMSTVACRAFKQTYPNSHLTFALSEKYKKILPLFKDHPDIDTYYLWQGYDDWPTERDLLFLKNNKYNIIYSPVPEHIDFDWYNKRHHCEERVLMYGLKPPEDLSCYLNPWFGKDDQFKNYISISAFPSYGVAFERTIGLSFWNDLILNINKMGYKCIQLGGEYDIQIENAEKPNLSILETAKILYSSKLHITVDTSWAWIGSAYKQNTVGIYGYHYKNQSNYPNCPVNENAKYILTKNLSDISLEMTLETIDIKLKR